MSNYEILKKVYKEFSIDLKNAKADEMAAYPWDECMADQIARYGDEETASKVCGAIKAGMQKSFAEGDSLEGACWPGYEAIGLKELDGRMVPNCVKVEEQSKQAFVIPGPQGGEDESTYISRCISEISAEYNEEGQAYAICKGKWDE
jgi:hypothetical protein